MIIMETRLLSLRCLDEGYQESGTYFVLKCGQSLSAITTDDYGSYFFIIYLRNLLGLELETAINVFYYGLIFLSFAVSLPAILRLLTAFRSRLVAFAGWLLLAAMLLRFEDVYLAAMTMAVALVPWALVFYRRGRVDSAFFAFCFAAGAAIAVANLIRSHSATAIGIFILVILATGLSAAWNRKAIAVVSLVLGLIAVNVPFARLVADSNAYLGQNVPNYEAPEARHHFWHNVYIGLGYIENDLGIKYDDNVSIKKAQQLVPGTQYATREYETILRREIFRVLVSNPVYVLKLFSAKLGAIAVYLLVYANVGLVAACLFPKGRALEAAFWGALAFSALPGLLVIPRVNFLSGFIAFAALYGIISLCHALEQAPPKELWNEVRARFKRA